MTDIFVKMFVVQINIQANSPFCELSVITYSFQWYDQSLTTVVGIVVEYNR